MKLFNASSCAALALVLLTGCGAGQQDAAMASMQLSSGVISAMPTTAAGPSGTGPSGTGPAVAAAAGANNPAPDCAAEGCASLRIIDGNAEAYRVDAMRRAAAEQS